MASVERRPGDGASGRRSTADRAGRWWGVPTDPALPEPGDAVRAAATPDAAAAAGGGQGAEEAEEFARRVADRLRLARYPHHLKRVVLSPAELAAERELEQRAAVWVPVVTFAVTAVCAVVVVLLAMTVAGDPAHGRLSEVVVVVATLGFLLVGFSTLARSQDYFAGQRPRGRRVRTDLADAYETVRDGVGVLVELGVPSAVLARVADLLPQAELLLDHLVEVGAAGGAVRGHPAYEQLILMGAEVTVLTDLAEERLGRRSSRRRDRRAEAVGHAVEGAALTPFDTLADLVAMLGPDVPRQRTPYDG